MHIVYCKYILVVSYKKLNLHSFPLYKITWKQHEEKKSIWVYPQKMRAL